MRNKYIEFLSPFVSDHKKEIIEKNLAQRTRYLTVVLEDIYQPQNASAVIRTCECLGIQDIYIVENRNTFEVNRDVVQGASKWISLHEYSSGEQSIKNCFEDLKSKGYHIVGMSPDESNQPLMDYIPEKKTALVFGTELEGLSGFAKENIDSMLKIPMLGFTESFNLSVSAAISLHSLVQKVRKLKVDWKLSDIEMEELRIAWYQNSIRNGEKLEAEFLRLYR